MRQKTAHAACANAPVRDETNWADADDHALVGGMLANNDGAWLEFLGRFDEPLTRRIEATIGRWSRMLRTREVIEAIKSDVHAYLISDGMRPLRAFDARYGSLADWLSRVAHACTM